MVSWKVPERTSIAAAAVDALLLEMSSTLKALGRVMTRYWKALFVPLQTSASFLHRSSITLGNSEGDGETDGEETAAERLILAKSEKEREVRR